MVTLILLSLGGAVSGSPVDDYVKKGRDHFGLFHFSEARDCFERAIEIDGRCFEAWFYLGNTLRKLNDGAGALKAYEKAYAIDADETDCKKALAGMYFQLARDARAGGNKQQMLDHLRRSVTVFPQNTESALFLFDLLAKDAAWDQILPLGDLVKRANRDGLDAGDDKSLQGALVIAGRAAIERQEFGRARDFLNAAGMIRRPNEELHRLLKGLPATTKSASVSLVAEGRALIEQKKYKAALDKLKQAQEAEPSNPELEGLLAEAQRRQSIQDFVQAADEAEKGNNLEEALEHLNRAIGLDEEDAALRRRADEMGKRFEQVQAERARKKREDLQKRQSAVEQNRKLASLLKAAKENESKQAFEAALTNFQQAAAMAPEDGEIQASIERLKERATEAQERRTRLGRDMRKANEFMAQAEYDQAYGLLKEVSEDSYAPAAEVLPSFIECLLKLDRLDEAETACRNLARIASGSNELTWARGVIAFRRQDYPAAAEILATITPKGTAQAAELSHMLWIIRWHKYKYGIFLCILFFGWKVLAWIHGLAGSFFENRIDGKIESLLSAGRYGEAIPLIEKRLGRGDAVPNRRQIILALSDAYLRTNRPHEARDKALEILAKDSRNAMAQRIAGEACFQARDISPEGMERILNLYKTDESRKDLLQYLAIQYKSQKADGKTALDLLHKHATMFPDDADTILYLATIYQRRSVFNQQTLKVFERAVRIEPDAPDWLQALAMSLQQSGRQEESERLFALGAEKWPDHPAFAYRHARPIDDEPSPAPERPKIALLAPGEAPPRE